ncbi:MAG: hypothetical protein QM820_19715 [Minicystis sp.]
MKAARFIDMRPSFAPRALLRGGAAAAILALCLGAPRGASAEEPRAPAARTLSIAWTRGAGAESCIAPDALRAAVGAKLGREVLAAPPRADLAVEARVELRAAGRWRAVITRVGAKGETLGLRELTSDAPSCRAFDDEITLVVALLLDPVAALAPATPQVASPAPAPAPDAAPAAPPEQPWSVAPPAPLPRPLVYAPARESPKRRWYGWQIILPWSISSLALTVATPILGQDTHASGARALPIVGLTGMMLSGPVVHMAHGRTSRALASFGINVGAPIVLGLAGWGILCASVDCKQTFLGPFSGAGGFLIGAGTGSVVAMLIDVAALSFEDGSEAASPERAFTLAPVADVRAGRAVFGLGGSF